MIKKHLIIVIRSVREGLSEPRLIKAICQGAVRPSWGCRPPRQAGAGWLAWHAALNERGGY